MKALLVSTSFKPSYGGPAVSVARLADALAEKGIDTAIWSPDGSASTARVDIQSDKVRRLGGGLSEVLSAPGAFDVIHDNGIWLPHNHRLAAVSNDWRIPRVVSPRGMLEPWALHHKRWKKKLAWTMYQKRDLNMAGALHATASVEGENINKLALTPRVFTIPNGISVPERCGHQPKSDVRVALFLGRVYPVKGLPMLIDAWASVRPNGWRLDIAGPDEGGHQRQLESAVKRHHLTEVVRFVGPVVGEEKASLFVSADLFVLPSYSESFGMAVAEALSYGLPVLTTKAVPWPQIEASGCGWRVDANVGAIARGLTCATSQSRSGLQAMGMRGLDVVSSEQHWCSVSEQVIRMYQYACGESGFDRGAR